MNKILMVILLLSSSFADFFSQTPLAASEATISPFRLVNEIRTHMEQDGIVVIFGAPCSGKSELLELALPENKHIFDLSDAFASAYADKTGEDKKTIIHKAQIQWTPEQEILREEQLIWLDEERQSIVNQLVASENGIIIMDEFDFMGASTPSAKEESAMEKIVSIAAEVKNSGKKIIFIVHAAAKNSSIFWKAMDSNLGYPSTSIVKTSFFTDEEEMYLLSQIEGSLEEKAEFMEFAEGSPIAYLPILKHKPNLSLHTLKTQAASTTRLIIQVTKQINRPEVWEIMTAVAKDKLIIDDIQDASIIEGMLESSFVGRKNGHLVMPGFAKECLSK